MYILGISSGMKLGHHDGAAVLMKNEKVLFAAEEERFTQNKHARSELPLNSIKYCLNKFKISIHDISYIASPLKTYPKYAERLKDFFKFHFGFSPKIILFNHQDCHAASAYYGSGFNVSTVVTCDNSGDNESGAVYVGKGGKLKKIFSLDRLNSLGSFYGMLTQFLGFQMTNDEYKIMGLAPYGHPRYLNEFKKIIDIENNIYQLNKKFLQKISKPSLYTTDLSTRQERVYSDELLKLLGNNRYFTKKITKKYLDLASSGQKILEIALINLCKEAIKTTGINKLCLAGGVFLNCKANMEVIDHCNPDNIYIPPVPNDPGVALGAAFLLASENGMKIQKIEHAYLGPSYSKGSIYNLIKRNNLRYKELSDPIVKTSELILNKKIVGWFNGRMEFGPRALGSRSILADPRIKNLKEVINKKIKFREEFRPLCPSILHMNQKDLFEKDFFSPFMNINFKAKDKKNNYKSVIHIDNTSRLQSVKKISGEKNNYFHLLKKVCDEDNLKCILNTSLNLNGQTLANSPVEALRTFYCSGIDHLILENFLISK